jgi:hypothetical protein
VDTPHGVRLSWGELASFGMDFWPQEAIEAALGADVAEAIPELLRLADLEVRIPRLEILALEHLADRDGKSVDAVLARELLDVVSANSDYLATAILGFTARASVAAMSRAQHAKRGSETSFASEARAIGTPTRRTPGSRSSPPSHSRVNSKP